MKLVQLVIIQHYSFMLNQIFSEMVPHLDGRVQRVLVEFLELSSDVQQIDLRATHHDSVQSRLICSTALTTSLAVRTHTFIFKLLS